jgi:transposase-like protein
MGTKCHKPEEIVAKPRQVEVLSAQGKSIGEAARSIGVSEQTYFRWRAVSDLTLDKLILAEAARKNF